MNDHLATPRPISAVTVVRRGDRGQRCDHRAGRVIPDGPLGGFFARHGSVPCRCSMNWCRMKALFRTYRVTNLLSHVTFAGYDQFLEAFNVFTSSALAKQPPLLVKQWSASRSWTSVFRTRRQPLPLEPRKHSHWSVQFKPVIEFRSAGVLFSRSVSPAITRILSLGMVIGTSFPVPHTWAAAIREV